MILLHSICRLVSLIIILNRLMYAICRVCFLLLQFSCCSRFHGLKYNKSSYFLSGLLGSFAPCMLYGSNVERIGGGPGTFANHCLPYTGLYLLGNSLFGWNCLSPWFSYPSRTAIRRKFNLEARCVNSLLLYFQLLSL